MKNRILAFRPAEAGRLIATFGEARLFILSNGATVLRGGGPGDQAAAQEWISLFMHEAVPRRECAARG